MERFFRMVFADEERWHVTESSWDRSPFDVLACRPVEGIAPIRLRIYSDGKRVDYDVTSFSTVVVSRRFAEVVSSIAPNDIQRLPAVVEGDDGNWEVLNVIACLDCIDHQRSIITSYYPQNHPEFPGEPDGVIRLMVDRSRIGDHQVFRPKGWTVAVIVSNTVRRALREIGVTGVEFIPVSD
jgi:hypothetical protein